MNDEEKTIYLNNGTKNEQEENGESTVYIGGNNSENGENTLYIGKNDEEVSEVSPVKTDNSNETDVSVLYYLPTNTMLQKRYRINSVLGEGGFGITYSGWDVILNIPVAIKEYYPSGLVTRNVTLGKTTQVIPLSSAKYGNQFRDGIDRVLDEARRMAHFRNTPGIVGIYDFFEANSTAYIVMEYIEGCTLDEYCKNNRMDNTTLFNMLVPVMDALQAMHNEGIIHRDISPDNIMVDDHGNFKLLDFGAARGYSEESLTTMSVILKKNYAPEEQFRTKGIQGPWTDVYALGASVYELITGQTPPTSIDRLVEDEIVDIRAVAPSLTKGQAEAVMTALAVRQKDRWQSVNEFKNALLHFAGNVPVESFQLIDSKKNEIGQINNKLKSIQSKFREVFKKIPEKNLEIVILLIGTVLLISIFCKSIVEKGSVYFGIRLSDIPFAIVQQYDISEGVYITGVYAGTSAAKSNLEAGDIIIAVDSVDITSQEDFKQLMSDYNKGDKVEITYFHLKDGEYEEKTKIIELDNKNKQDARGLLISYAASTSEDINDSNAVSNNDKETVDETLKENDLSNKDKTVEENEISKDDSIIVEDHTIEEQDDSMNEEDHTIEEQDDSMNEEDHTAEEQNDNMNEEDPLLQAAVEPPFNFDIPDYLDIKYITSENIYGKITFYYNVTNNSEESIDVSFESFGYVQGVDTRASTNGKTTIKPGETSSIGCSFFWSNIGCAGFETIDNVVFKIIVKEDKDDKKYLDKFNQCIRFDKEESDWVACSFDEIDNSGIETTGVKNYIIDEWDFSIRYIGYTYEYGYLTFYMYVTNNSTQSFYCDFDNYQSVNGISIWSSDEGNNIVLPGTTSLIGCSINEDTAENAGIEEICDVEFNMYVKSDQDSKSKDEFTYKIIYSTDENEYVADN